jgi:Mn2+/Fe2+ NRAMP family transporter
VELGAEPPTSCAERGALPRTPINIGDIALDEPRRPARRKLFQVLGPGLITGASDDDPSGIATYSQVGAQFGYGLAWTLVFSYPLMAAIQEISARIGRVTGFGIAGNLRRHYPAWLSGSIVLLLLSANLINLGADLGAMGAALKLLIGGPALLYVVLFGALSAGLQIFTRYARYISILKWGCLALFSYVICAFVVHVAWGEVAWAIVWPPLSFKAEYLMAVVAVLGTTISPYLFFWQAGQEVEDTKEGRRGPSANPSAGTSKQRIHPYPHRYLYRHGDLQPRRLVYRHYHRGDAEREWGDRHPNLRSGRRGTARGGRAADLRGVRCRHHRHRHAGITGAGGISRLCVGRDAFLACWLGAPAATRQGVLRDHRGGHGAGRRLNFSTIDPIRALYWSAVLNGVVAVPVMVTMMLLAMSRSIMAGFTLPLPLLVPGWLATATMAATTIAMVASWLG